MVALRRVVISTFGMLCRAYNVAGLAPLATIHHKEISSFGRVYAAPAIPCDVSVKRRETLGILMAMVTMGVSPPSHASADQTKPFAPKEALLPAVRVRLTIDRAIVLTDSLSQGSDVTSILQELENLLLKPQNYVRSLKLQGVPSKPSDLYLESYKPMKGDLPFQRILIRQGDVDTWKNLKRSEKSRERENEILAALNAYTDFLSFSPDSYILNVDRATRSDMVRGDRLPAVQQVITSDMGLRYLYRNQILTAIDDAKAELKYLSSHVSEGAVDSGELLDLLKSAHDACDRWFGLIDPAAVKEAFEAIEVGDA